MPRERFILKMVVLLNKREREIIMANKKMRLKLYVLIFSVLFILFFVFSSATVFAARQTIITKSNEFRIDLVRYDPSPMVPGKDATLYFEISNLKNVALSNLQITFVDTYPFTASETSSITIDRLEPGQVRSFEFVVRPNINAPAGTYTPSLQFYSPTLGSFNSEIISLAVQNPAQIISFNEVSTNPEVVAPGKVVKVGLNLVNTYSSTLRDISVKLNLENATYFSPKSTTSEANLKYLSPGSSEKVEFELVVSPNAPADAYRIPVTLTYVDDSGASTTKSTYIGVRVNQEPVYSAYLEDITAFEKNKAGKVVISISNVGPVDIKYLNVRLLESSSYQSISKSQVYIGNLKPDDYQTAEFQIYRKSSGPLKVFLEYKDSYGNQYSKVEDIAMPLFSDSEAVKYGLVVPSGTFTNLLYIIFTLLLVWVIWEWYEHKSLKTAINYVFLGVIAWSVDAVKFFKPSNLSKRFKEVKEHLRKREAEKK